MRLPEVAPLPGLPRVAAALRRYARNFEPISPSDDTEPGDRDGPRSFVFEPGGLGRILPRARRIAVLERLSRELGADARILLQETIAGERTHLGRAVLDAPRRVVRAATRTPLGEWGDRVVGGEVRHLFFSADALLEELAEAGLVTISAEGDRIVAARGRAVKPAPLAREIARALAIFPALERQRRGSPAAAIAWARAGGRSRRARDAWGRARLARAISWVDAVSPPRSNCLRRVLAEIALDGGAARETLRLGLDPRRTGHAWLVPCAPGFVRENPRFDVVFEV